MQHRKGRLESGLVQSLETLQKIFSAAEVIFLVCLTEYSAAEAPGIKMCGVMAIGSIQNDDSPITNDDDDNDDDYDDDDVRVAVTA